MDKNNFSTFLRNNINDRFWDNYIELVRNEMIPYQLMALNDEIDGAPKSYCLENFKKAAKVIQKINNNKKLRYTLLTDGNIRKTNVTKIRF